MSRRERDKGRKAEAEVRAVFERYGFTVRGLEATGDHLASGYGYRIHSEVKRQETLRLPLWCRQARAEAPPGTLPLLSYRRSRESWNAAVPEQLVLAQLRGAAYVAGVHYALREINGEWFALLPLARLLEALVLGAILASPQEALS